MTKRVLSLVLAMLTLFSLCAPALAADTRAADEPEVTAYIVDSGYCGDEYKGQTYNVSWTLTSDGTLTISGHGDICHCTIYAAPWSEYNSVSQTITNDRIKAVIIKNGVTGIGGAAFEYHKNLRSMTISNSVTHIDGMAFEGCRKLTSITIPKSVKSIGLVAFGECSGLKTITILNKNCNDKTRRFIMLPIVA